MCILLYYALGNQMGGPLAGAAAAWLIAFGYGSIQQSQVVRNYTLLTLFIGLAFYYYRAFLAERKTTSLVIFTASGILALMTHYSAFFALGCMGAGGIFRLLREGRPSRPALVKWIMAGAVLVAYFACQYLADVSTNPYLAQFQHNAEVAAATPPYNSLSYRLQLFTAYAPAVASYFIHSSFDSQLNIPSGLALLLALWVVFTRRRGFFYETLLALLLGATLLAYNAYPYMFRIAGRYAVWLMPYVVLSVSLLAASVAGFLGGKLTGRQRGAAQWGLATASILLGLWLNSGDTRLNDRREYQLSRLEFNQLRDFVNRIPETDAIVTRGLQALYLMPQGTQYYRLLRETSRQSDYYQTQVAGGTPLFIYQPIRIFSLAEILRTMQRNSALEHAGTVWFLETDYYTSPWRTPECINLPVSTFSVPPQDTLAPQEDARVALYGIARETLRKLVAQEEPVAACAKKLAEK